MIVYSDACTRIAKEYCNSHILSLTRIRSILVKLALPFGKLRLTSIKLLLSKTEYDKLLDLDYDMLINCSTYQVDEDRMLREFCTLASITGSREARLLEKYKSLTQRIRSQDELQICRGHDLTRIFCLLVRKGIGKLKFRDKDIIEHGVRHIHIRISDDAFESSIRLSYRFEDFKRSDTYKSLVQWETDNPKYPIFS